MFATIVDMVGEIGKPVTRELLCFAPIPAKPSLPELLAPPLSPPPPPPGVGSGRLDLVGEDGALAGEDVPILMGEAGCEVVWICARLGRVGDVLETEDNIGVFVVVPMEVLTGGNWRGAPGEGRGRR